MIMKKLICCILAAVLVLALAIGVYAEETTCVVSADALTAAAGDTVTVPVRISENPGFTNFAMELHYDSEVLTLTAIEAVAGDVTSVNLSREGENGESCGYVVSASASAITEDTVLFNAVFTVSTDFSDTTEITPVVTYIRNNAATLSVFEAITATEKSGSVEPAAAILLGDVNGDGAINFDDMQLVYKAAAGMSELTDAQTEAADVDGNGTINFDDMQLVYKYAAGSIEAFPAA